MSGHAAAIDVATRFFAALHEARWSDAAALCEPSSAAQYRDHELAALVVLSENREAMKQAPGRLVGYSTDGVLTDARLAQQSDIPLREIPGIPTIGDLAQLSPQAFIAVCLQEGSSSDSQGLEDQPRRPRATIIGVVIDDAVAAHVLFRLVGGGVKYDDPHYVELLRLRHGGGRWMVDIAASRHSFSLGPPLAFRLMDGLGLRDRTPGDDC